MRSLGLHSVLVVALLLLQACEKVPVIDIGASFTLANASWFQDEETMFIFYKIEAYQGLGPDSQIELTYRTDELEQGWKNIDDLPAVHRHLPVDCGPYAKCGSTSIRVKLEPRDVEIRLRYHKDGALTLGSQTELNVVGSGPPQVSRSLIVYGVFDAENSHVQWRARHQMPRLRNQEVEDLGLRRYFRVENQRYGDITGNFVVDNPYGYGLSPTCPADFTPLDWALVATTTRAIFSPETVPISAFVSSAICGEATVLDAKGTFTTNSLAQKNPQVRAAFPTLHNPIKTNTVVGFVLVPCQSEFAAEHFAMQKQRTLLENAPQICIDGFASPTFADELASRFRTGIEAARLSGHDMVLGLVLQHADTTGVFTTKVEQALAMVLPFERDKTSPRVSGAFIFDSLGHTIKQAEVARLALWCPANTNITDLDLVNSISLSTCPVQPDLPDLILGPVKFSSLPILPTRPQYEKFVEKYGDAQTGKMLELQFLAPERTPLSENVPIGDFGVVTFFNNETLAAEVSDAFSYCASEDFRTQLIAVRLPEMPDVPFPLQSLGEVHLNAPHTLYELGLGWEFPYLLRLKYETVLAGAATALSFTVPFGIRNSAETYYGSQAWSSGDFSLDSVLKQCKRFCDSPTFDNAGVYQPQAIFRTTYPQQCYLPVFPVFDAAHSTEGGYPLDP